jgi:hypothetical protein
LTHAADEATNQYCIANNAGSILAKYWLAKGRSSSPIRTAG